MKKSNKCSMLVSHVGTDEVDNVSRKPGAATGHIVWIGIAMQGRLHKGKNFVVGIHPHRIGLEPGTELPAQVGIGRKGCVLRTGAKGSLGSAFGAHGRIPIQAKTSSKPVSVGAKRMPAESMSMSLA